MNKGPFQRILQKRQTNFDKLSIDQKTREALSDYLLLAWNRNQTLNLVSRKTTPDEWVDNHLFDCLIALPYLPQTSCVADLGSGAGFPAIPFALCRPNTKFILYEKSPQKRKFLKSCCSLAKNLEIRGALEEGLCSEVDCITARGFKPLPKLFAFTKSYFAKKGLYVLLKGRKSVIDKELEDANIKANSVRIQKLNPVGKADERHLIILNG